MATAAGGGIAVRYTAAAGNHPGRVINCLVGRHARSHSLRHPRTVRPADHASPTRRKETLPDIAPARPGAGDEDAGTRTAKAWSTTEEAPQSQNHRNQSNAMANSRTVAPDTITAAHAPTARLPARANGSHRPGATQRTVQITFRAPRARLGLHRSDGHPPSGAHPRKGCPAWRPWSGRSPVPVGRSSRSSRPTSSSDAKPVTAQIKAVHDESKGTYGSPGVNRELGYRRVVCGR